MTISFLWAKYTTMKHQPIKLRGYTDIFIGFKKYQSL